jgi:predicted nucleic acid-binding Zn ribbon protein
MSDASRTRCPKCKAVAERRITGGAGLLFKGEGFYITDYRSESYKQAAKRETGDSPGAGSKETKGEKPAGGEKAGKATKGEPGKTGGGTKAAED